jgi:hypothetical protein
MAAFYGDARSTGKTILHDHDPRSASYWPLADYVHKPTLALVCLGDIDLQMSI